MWSPEARAAAENVRSQGSGGVVAGGQAVSGPGYGAQNAATMARWAAGDFAKGAPKGNAAQQARQVASHQNLVARAVGTPMPRNGY